MVTRYCTVAIIATLLQFAGANDAHGQSFGGSSRTGGGGSGFGSGGFGSSGFGGSSGGSQGFAASEERFQVDQSAGSGFVGRDSGDARSFFSALEGAQQSFLQDLGLQPRNNRGRSSGNRQAPPVRITLRVAFDTTPANTAFVGAQVQESISRSLQPRGIAPQVTVRGRTVILQGQTATEYEKLLAEKMALIEPGVSTVENRLTVVPR